MEQRIDTDMALTVTPMTRDDWAAVSAIYAEGIATGDATFEAEPPTWDAWKLPTHTSIGGWRDGVARSRLGGCHTRLRALVYAGVVETSVYVTGAVRGTGVGRALLAALIESTEAAGIWTIQAGIFPRERGEPVLSTAPVSTASSAPASASVSSTGAGATSC